jgi:hypothetical protein
VAIVSQKSKKSKTKRAVFGLKLISDFMDETG